MRAVVTSHAGTRARRVVTGPLRILIVDDHTMLRSGLKALLTTAFDAAVFGDASDGAEACECLRSQSWDIVLLDIALPGRSGLEVLKDLQSEWPRVPVLVLSGHKEDQLAVRAVKAGARGYMTKDSAPDDLACAVRKILDGGRYITATLGEQLASHAHHDPCGTPHETLSDREYDVMGRIASGNTVGEIADQLSLSVKTISTYRSRVLEKLRLRNNAEIVRYAIRNGLVDCS
jgi:two-component system, NarL family, invasion response regulator UvrY